MTSRQTNSFVNKQPKTSGSIPSKPCSRISQNQMLMMDRWKECYTVYIRKQSESTRLRNKTGHKRMLANEKKLFFFIRAPTDTYIEINIEHCSPTGYCIPHLGSLRAFSLERASKMRGPLCAANNTFTWHSTVTVRSREIRHLFSMAKKARISKRIVCISCCV